MNIEKVITRSDYPEYYYGADGCLYPIPPPERRFFPIPLLLTPLPVALPPTWQGVAMPLVRTAVVLPRPASGPTHLPAQLDSYPQVPAVEGGFLTYPYHAFIGGRFLVNHPMPVLGLSSMSVLLMAQDIMTGKEVALKINRHPQHSQAILNEGSTIRAIQTSEPISICFMPQHYLHFEMGPDDEISNQFLSQRGNANTHSCLVMEKMGADLHEYQCSIHRYLTLREIQTFARDLLSTLSILDRYKARELTFDCR